MSLLGGVIAGAGSIAGSLIGANAEKQSTAATNKANLGLAKLQNKWNLEQWNRENEYNSPKAQMARYAEAGLNPDLIYGQQNLAAGSPAMTSGAPAQKSNHGEYLQTGLLNASNIAADIALKRAQARNLDADTGKKGAETDTIEYNLSYLESTDQVRKALLDNEVQLGFANIKLNESETALNGKRIDEIGQDIIESKARCNEISARIDNLQMQFKLLSEEHKRSLIDTAMHSEKSKAALNVLYSEYRKNIAQAEYQETYNQFAERTIMSIINMNEASAAAANASAGKSSAETYVIDTYGGAKAVSEIVRNYGTLVDDIVDIAGQFFTKGASKGKSLLKGKTKRTEKDKHGSTTYEEYFYDPT